MSRSSNRSPHATSASQTEITDAQSSDDSSRLRLVGGTLRLRGHRAENTMQTERNAGNERRVRWAEDVVDNEGQGKKSSKVCCIYHKPREVGESSSESDSESSSSSGSDSEVDDGEARMSNSGGGRRQNRRNHGPHDHQCGDDDNGHEPSQAATRKQARGKPVRNAYERVPGSSKLQQNQGGK